MKCSCCSFFSLSFFLIRWVVIVVVIIILCVMLHWLGMARRHMIFAFDFSSHDRIFVCLTCLLLTSVIYITLQSYLCFYLCSFFLHINKLSTCTYWTFKLSEKFTIFISSGILYAQNTERSETKLQDRKQNVL